MSERSSGRQIPVVVLAGFLGSGKTTLLNHLLHRSGGSRIGAVVNDFGAIEIDAMAVAGALGDSTVSLGNGCLCCAVDGSELDVYLERLARPSAGIDVIVIEASGLAEPQELVRMVLASEHPGIVYGGLVEVVDAAEFDDTRARHPEIDRHLGLADLVVVNKVDRITDASRVLTLVSSLVDRAAVVPATHGRVDPEFLFDCRPGRSASHSSSSSGRASTPPPSARSWTPVGATTPHTPTSTACGASCAMCRERRRTRRPRPGPGPPPPTPSSAGTRPNRRGAGRLPGG